jgi:VanZ family protein
MIPEPATPGSRAIHTLGLIALAAALLGLWHFGGFESGNRLVHAFHAAAHFPLFGLLAAVIFALLRLHGRGSAAHGRGTYLATFLAMLAVSLVTEGLQTLQPAREASLRDVLVNLLGTATVLSLIRLREARLPGGARAALWAIVLGATLVVAVPLAALSAAYVKRALDFPTLLRFDLPLDRLRVSAADARLERRSLPPQFVRPGDTRSLCVVFGDASFPGITIPDPVPDWRGYDALELDLSNPEPRPLRLSLRIDDQAHDGRREDRFNRQLELPAESRERIRIPLDAIRDAPEDRQMALDDIARILLFARAPDRGRQFCLTRITLIELDQ